MKTVKIISISILLAGLISFQAFSVSASPDIPITSEGPDIPSVDSEGPDVPTTSDGPDIPSTTSEGPDLPDAGSVGPDMPGDGSEGPDIPGDSSEGPDIPSDGSEGPDIPGCGSEDPSDPGDPGDPGTPDLPVVPDDPVIPDDPGDPDVPEGPDIPEDPGDDSGGGEFRPEPVADTIASLAVSEPDSYIPGGPSFIIEKLVSDLKEGSSFVESVEIKPGELIGFSINISANNGSFANFSVKDVLPENIVYTGGLKVNGTDFSGDITSGINIDFVSASQPKTITFYGKIADPDNFNFGQTKLTNTVFVKKGYVEGSDTAEVVVLKSEVLGAATDIATGLTNNMFLDTFFLPLLLTLIIIWAFKSHIIKYEEWLDKRKTEYRKYKSDKSLHLKIAREKTKEFIYKKLP